MPRWLTHARNLAGLRRRWGITSPVSEVLSGVLPVVQVDKHRSAEDSDIWGMFVQAVADGVNLPACALSTQEREVLVHKVEFTSNFVNPNLEYYHLFTPLQTYTPFDVASGAFFAWVQGRATSQDRGQLGNTFGVGGLGSAHQVVVVNAVPVTTFGPLLAWEQLFLGGLHSVVVTNAPKTFWSFQDPPIRLKPFTLLCVQSTGVPIINTTLNVSFWYSERPPQGDVG